MIDRIDSVFLFGTGIVCGAWEPVLRALAKKYGTNLGRDAKGQDVATRWLGLHGINTPSEKPDQELAHWVFGVRVNSARIVASLGSARNRNVKRANDGMRAELLALKKTIASELHAAQDSGETRLREGPVAAAMLDAGEGSSAMLTTNWDLNRLVASSVRASLSTRVLQVESTPQPSWTRTSSSSRVWISMTSNALSQTRLADFTQKKSRAQRASLAAARPRSKQTLRPGREDPHDGPRRPSL